MPRRSIDDIASEYSDEGRRSIDVIAHEHTAIEQRLRRPSDTRTFMERQVHGMKAPFYGAAHGVQRWSDEFQKAADIVAKKTGIESGRIFETLGKVFGPPSDYHPKGFWEEVSFGLSDGMADILPMMAMKAHPSVALGTVGGFHGMMEEGTPGFLKGTAMGVAMGPIFKFGAYARRSIYAPGVGALFAAQSLAEDPSDIRGAARNFTIGLLYTLGQGLTGKQAQQAKDLANFENFMLRMRQKGLSYKDVVFPDLKGGMRVFARGEGATVVHVDKAGDVWVRTDSKPTKPQKFIYDDVIPQSIEFHNPTIKEIYGMFAADYKARHPKLSKNAIHVIDSMIKIKGSGGAKVGTERTYLEFTAMQKMADPELRTFMPWLRKQLLTTNRQIIEMGPEAVNLIYWPMKIAEHRAMLHFDVLNRRVRDIFKGLPIGASRRIIAYAHSKQVGGSRLLRAAGFSSREIKNLKLSDAEKNAYTALREILESQYSQINEAHRMAGIPLMPKVTNYFTFAQAVNYLDSVGLSHIGARAKDVTDVISRFVRPRQTSAPFTNPRTGAIYKPLLDAKELMNRYIRYSTKHIHMTPTISHIRDLLQPWQVGYKTEKDGSFKLDAEGKRIPKIWDPQERMPASYEMLQEWLNYASGIPAPPDQVIGPEVKRILKRANKNLGYAMLSFNVRSSLIQPSAIRNTVVELGPKHTMIGIMSLVDPAVRNRAFEKSRVLRGRAQELFTRDVFSGMQQGKYYYPLEEWVGRSGMKFLQVLDFYTAMATWEGAYRKAKVSSLHEEGAVRFADDVVSRTQASSSALDISPIQRSAAGRTLTMFQTFVINDANFFFHDILGKRVPNSAGRRAHMMLKYFLATTLVNKVYEDGLNMTSPYGAPIRKFRERLAAGESWKWALGAALREGAELSVIAGGAIRYGSSPIGPLADQLTDFINFFQQRTGERKIPVREVVQTLATLAGVPGIRQIYKAKRAYQRGGDVTDISLGRYVEPKRKHPHFPPRMPGVPSIP